MKVTNILWETDGLSTDELGLPTEVELPSNIDKDDYDAINNYLSDTYGWLVIDYLIDTLQKDYELYEVVYLNGKVVETATADTYDKAVEIYNENNGFMLTGIDSPECFEVLLARPLGVATIS